MPNTNGNDPKGERGGDTGHSDQVGKGVQAEKGDQRREGSDHTVGNRNTGHHEGRSGTHARDKGKGSG